MAVVRKHISTYYQAEKSATTTADVESLEGYVLATRETAREGRSQDCPSISRCSSEDCQVRHEKAEEILFPPSQAVPKVCLIGAGQNGAHHADDERSR